MQDQPARGGGVVDLLAVDGHLVVCDDGLLDAELRSWIVEQDVISPSVDKPLPPCGPSAIVDRLGAARLAPAVAVVNGEVR